MTHSCEMSFQPDPRMVWPVTHFVETFAASCGLPREDAHDLALAAVEAVTNAVVHAYEGEDQGEIRVACQRTDGHVEVAVSDLGLPFDPERVAAYSPPLDLDDFVSHGLGFFIMRSLTDEVKIENLGTQGKRVLLRKTVKAEDVPDALPAAPVADATLDDIEIRMMTPADAIGVARCLYRVYGFTYLHEDVYHPDLLIEKNRSGAMLTSVGVTPDGEVVGTQSMVRSRPDSRIYESGVAAVAPAYRAHGLGGRLAEPLQRALQSAHAVGLLAYGVTEHTFSQQMMDKSGFRVCGVLLGNASAKTQFKGMEHIPQRGSVVVGCLDWVGGWKPVLYAPPAHRHMLERIYENIRWHPTFATPDGPARPAETRLTSGMGPLSHAGYLLVDDIGDDCEARLWRETQALRRKGSEVVFCHLPLRNPHTPAVAEHLEQRGFFFAGVTPGEGHGDTSLVMELLGVVLDYDDIHVHSDMAKTLLAYMRERDPNQ